MPEPFTHATARKRPHKERLTNRRILIAQLRQGSQALGNTLLPRNHGTTATRPVLAGRRLRRPEPTQGGAALCTQILLIGHTNARVCVEAIARVAGHLEIVHHDDRTPPITHDERQFLPQRQVREPMRVQIKKHALKRTTRILKQLRQETTTVPKVQIHPV